MELTPPPRPPRLLEVGTVVRSHGLRGQVVVALTTNRAGRLAAGAGLVADGRSLSVVAATPAPGAGADRWLVTFSGVDSRDGADALRGAVLCAEAVDEPGVLWVHELIGATVTDVAGATHGVVTEVQANPASDLLVLDTGALVPLHFVVAHSGGAVTVDVPDGLWELFA